MRGEADPGYRFAYPGYLLADYASIRWPDDQRKLVVDVCQHLAYNLAYDQGLQKQGSGRALGAWADQKDRREDAYTHLTSPRPLGRCRAAGANEHSRL